MKKLIFISILLAGFFFASTAQTEQGKILVGGSSDMGFNLTTNKQKIDNDMDYLERTTEFSFNPIAGYFIIDNLAAGLEFPVFLSYNKRDNDDKTNITGFGVAPFVRYYFDIGAGIFKPFLQGHIGFGTKKTKEIPNNGPEFENSEGFFTFGLTGGVGIFFAENISLDIAIGYSSVTTKPEDSDIKQKDNNIGLNLGFVFTFLL